MTKDLFQKCYDYNQTDELKARGIYPYFRPLGSKQDVEVIMDGKRRIMLGSNNYLGLTVCPEVVEAAARTVQEYGTGCSGSRFLNGTLEMHLELEKELAAFLGKEDVLTFSTGFQSNLGIISALVGMHDYVICDMENHASIYDGCRLSFGKLSRYRHSDMADLEAKLQKVPEGYGALVGPILCPRYEFWFMLMFPNFSSLCYHCCPSPEEKPLFLSFFWLFLSIIFGLSAPGRSARDR